MKNGGQDALYSQAKQVGILTSIPMLLLVGPAIGLYLGGWVDRKFQIYPWMTILFVFLGFFAAGREVMRLLKLVSKENEETKKK